LTYSIDRTGTNLVVLILVCLLATARGYAATVNFANTSNPAAAPGAMSVDSATPGPTGYENTRFDFSEAIAGPPKYESLEVTGTTVQAKRSAEEIVSSGYGNRLAAGKWGSVSAIFGVHLGSTNFEDGNFTGSARTTGFTVGGTFDDRYEIGFEYSSNVILESIFDDLFHSAPSFDEGRDLVNAENAYLTSKMLYLRGNWRVSENFTGFALAGYSQIELEIEQTNLSCSALIILIPICLDSSVDTFTTYSNEESGLVWGVGLEWKRTPHSYLSLRYIDQSIDNFDYSGLSFAFGFRE